MPKFSIIVGVYNHKETLPILIDALNRQTFKDFEVHFCDDGSDDFSRNSILGLQKTFKYKWISQEHRGMRLARNLNHGIKEAKGEYCVFIMGDSFPEQDYLEILNEWVQPYRMICGVRVQLDKIGGKLEGVDMDWRIKKGLIPKFPSVILGDPFRCFTGNGLTIPTQAFRLYGPWWEAVEGYGGEDNEIVARLFYKGYVPWSVPDLRIYHHWHKNQPSGNRKQVTEKIIGYYMGK